MNNSELTRIDHKAYQLSLVNKTNDMLRYTINDASLAIRAMPQGHKAGYYADEIHYCYMELQARRA